MRKTTTNSHRVDFPEAIPDDPLSSLHRDESEADTMFRQMAERTLGRADAPTRRAIAARLATQDVVPPGLIERLCEDADDLVAIVALSQSAVVDRALLMRVAEWGPTARAAAVAARPDLDDELVVALAGRSEETILRALARNGRAPLPLVILHEMARRARGDADGAKALLARGETKTMGALFVHASPDARRDMLDEILSDAGSNRHSGAPDPRLDGLAQELFKASTVGPEALATVLAHHTGLPREGAIGVVTAEGGEPLAIALSALGLAPEQATPVLLFADPRVGRSAPRVFALVALMRAFTPATAQRMFAEMTGRALA